MSSRDEPALTPDQEKTIDTTIEALQDDKDSTLPPLMNPTMLEASDDLTNLSHLNEPAGPLRPPLSAQDAR